MTTSENSTQLKTLFEPVLLPLAKLSVTTNFEDIPQDVLHQAALSLLDTLGCIIGGYHLKEAEKVIQVEKDIGGRSEASILCSGDKVPVMAAARANGYMGDILEFNDLPAGHSGIGTIPAALAMAEYQRTSGKRLLRAIVIGYEVAGRIYDTYHQYHKDSRECCINTPGLVNAFAAAAVASTIFDLDVEKTFNAINMAGSFAAIAPKETNESGGTVKAYLFGGWPASVGIYAAICAKNGLTGAPRILEGNMGLLRTLAHTFDLNHITHKLGDKWALERPRRKAQASAGYTHSPIEATLSAIKENNISLADIEQIELLVAPYTIPMVGGESPVDAMTARFSLRYLVAVSICKMSYIMPEDTMEGSFDRYMASGIPQIMKKINIKPEPLYPYYTFCTAKVKTNHGNEYIKYIEHPKGDPENPLTESELLLKFRHLADPVFKPDKIDQIIEEVYALEKKDDLTALINSLIVR